MAHPCSLRGALMRRLESGAGRSARTVERSSSSGADVGVTRGFPGIGRVAPAGAASQAARSGGAGDPPGGNMTPRDWFADG
jgi:hypothetical protein